jgi:hypothetical protein
MNIEKEPAHRVPLTPNDTTNQLTMHELRKEEPGKQMGVS